MKTMTMNAALAVTLLAATPSLSATLIATDLPTLGSNISFTIDFTDANHNGLFDLSELTAFSGFLNAVGAGPIAIIQVPQIAGISVAGTAPGGVVGPFKQFWFFDDNADNRWDFGMARENWNYEITGVTASAPVPASLPLLLAGLGWMAFVSRKRKA